MAEEKKMTLTERLRNPAYGQEDRLVADMKEAADAIDELRAQCDAMNGSIHEMGQEIELLRSAEKSP